MSQLTNWKILKQEDISPSKWFKLVKDTVELPSGKIIEYFSQQLGDVVMIFSVNNKNEVVFVQQYKHGIGKVVLELPAGRIDEKADVISEAIREFLEETGYRLNNLEFISKIITEPSKSNVQVNCFYSNDIEFVNGQCFDENEEIEVVLVPLEQINQKIKKGEIEASDTLALIKLVEIHHPEIFK